MRTHRTMALAATLSIAAGAAVSDLPPAFSAQADVSSTLSHVSDDAPSAEAILAGLRQCESSGNYSADNGDGYYGAYQFDEGTWNSLGYQGHANEAPPEVQDEAVVRLQARSGWAPWPACSAELGLAGMALPPLTPPAPEPSAEIAVVPLTAVSVVEAEAEPPRPRRFREVVAEFG